MIPSNTDRLTPGLKEAFIFIVSLLLGSIFWSAREAHSVLLEAATPELMFRGEAETPWQYRDLVPLLVRALSYISGNTFGDHMPAYLLIDRATIVGIFYSTAVLLRKFGESPGWLLVVFLMMLANYAYGSVANYLDPFDMPAQLFFTLGLIFLRDRNLRAYYLLLPFALLNRETAVVLTVVFGAVYYRTMPNRTLAAHIITQAVMIAVVKLSLWLVFINNAGPGIASVNGESESRLLANFHDLAAGKMLPVFAGMYLPFLIALPLVGSSFIRRALLVMPPFLASMMFVANIIEFRVFSEMIPLIGITLADGLPRLARKFKK